MPTVGSLTSRNRLTVAVICAGAVFWLAGCATTLPDQSSAPTVYAAERNRGQATISRPKTRGRYPIVLTARQGRVESRRKRPRNMCSVSRHGAIGNLLRLLENCGLSPDWAVFRAVRMPSAFASAPGRPRCGR
jgi:hypothetical protein